MRLMYLLNITDFTVQYTVYAIPQSIIYQKTSKKYPACLCVCFYRESQTQSCKFGITGVFAVYAGHNTATDERRAWAKKRRNEERKGNETRGIGVWSTTQTGGDVTKTERIWIFCIGLQSFDHSPSPEEVNQMDKTSIFPFL